ncbi:MAG: cell division protein FtsL [Gammaproteobacteria bacterium]|nr:cell division protein FtsL [Gammaproteobacteria bacterium]
MAALRATARQSQSPWLWPLLVVMGVAVLLSALTVVYAKFKSRTLFSELQALQAEKDGLDVEWGQLQLEQSTLTAHGRIEGIARSRLGLTLPTQKQVVIVRR